MPKLGAITFNQDHKALEEDLETFGPIVASGNLEVRSIRAFGPTIIKGKLVAEALHVKGPLTVCEDLIAGEIEVIGPMMIDGSLQLSFANIKGPVVTRGEIRAADELLIKGSLKAKSIQAGALRIKGSVDVEGEIVATDEITITVTFKRREEKGRLHAQLLKAPFVEIRGKKGGISRFIGILLRGRASRRHLLMKMDVPIEADEVVLNRVQHTGDIVAKDIILENGAQYVKTHDAAQKVE